MDLAPSRDGMRDFDFLMGSWHVRCRRLRHPLRVSEEWYEFEGTSHNRALWDGAANVEEVDFASPLGRIRGMAVRVYDPATRMWSIYWGTSTAGLNVDPNVGSFDESGAGEFFSDELFEGTPIVSRYRWTHDGPNAARWEQAFSADGGMTWQINWIMDFTRAA